jgi:hypothetical protein
MMTGTISEVVAEAHSFCLCVAVLQHSSESPIFTRLELVVSWLIETLSACNNSIFSANTPPP